MCNLPVIFFKQAMTPQAKPTAVGEGDLPPVQQNQFEEEEETLESVLGRSHYHHLLGLLKNGISDSVASRNR